MKERESSGIGGFSANSLVIPLVVVLAILHIVIISLVFEVNRANRELVNMTQDSGDYQQYATNLQAGCSTLSETASGFAQMPVTKDGSFNTGPLLRYAQELGRNRRGPQVAEWFKAHDVGAEVQSYIDAAAMEDDQMFQIQLHAIALLCSVYPRPPVEELSAIPDYPLTEEELAMPEEARGDYARSLILGKDYSLHRAAVAENIENCHRVIQQEHARASAARKAYIAALRVWMWGVIIVIIAIMLCIFVLFYRWLIMPLRTYARQITSDESMKQMSKVREMRLVVNAYNALLRRRDKLESILRSAAETDTLTDLPNRYSLEHYVLEIGEYGGSMAVLLFDVNYLKRENDTKGHQAGDDLLRTAGACIRECFETEDNGRCYRIGGDEFAAVLRECTEEEVRGRIDRFALACERENISVSVGFAFTEKSNENSFDQLMQKADKRMYAQKKRVHKQDQAAR